MAWPKNTTGVLCDSCIGKKDDALLEENITVDKTSETSVPTEQKWFIVFLIHRDRTFFNII